MNKLGCNVKTCVHNENRLCCLKQIDVSGKGALNSDMTCCSSFAKEKGALANVLRACPDCCTDIKCDVENCAYNEHHCCKAAHVDIIGAQASTCGQTECSTFKQR